MSMYFFIFALVYMLMSLRSYSKHYNYIEKVIVTPIHMYLIK